MGEVAARQYAKLLGVVYGVITIAGFAQGPGKLLNLFLVNTADNYLHVLLALIFLYTGFATYRAVDRYDRTARAI